MNTPSFHRKTAVLLSAALVLFLWLDAGAAVKTEECLECHDTFKTYSHRGVGCADCHSTITSLPHPDKVPKPACVTCHEKTVSLYGGGIHKQKGLDCKQCHDVHFLQKEKKHCASCHRDVAHPSLPSAKKHLKALACIGCHGAPEKTDIRVHLDLTGSENMALDAIGRDQASVIDKAEWHGLEDLLQTKMKDKYTLTTAYRVVGDPHGVTAKRVECSKCHGERGYFLDAKLEISNKEKVERTLDRRIFIPELPSIKEFGNTVHGKAGVVCADCHLSQKRIAEGWSENTTVCIRCHEETAEVYDASIHSRVGATHCVDCHNPHRIKSYREREAPERIAICTRCHKDYLRKHAWLPNTSLHFSYLECADCHSPRSEKSMVFYFARKTPSGKVRLSHDDLLGLCGEEPSNLVGSSPDSEIGRAFSTLRTKDKNVIIDASIIVTRAYHDYSETTLKERRCVTCHSREAAFYNSMFFLLPCGDSTTYVPLKGSLLATYPIGTSIDFFLLGQDKIKREDFRRFLSPERLGGLGFKWIDFFGLLVIALIAVGVAGHIILRLTVKR